MISSLINIIVFIIFIPELLFTLPKNGNRKTIAAVHGILYSLCYMLLTIVSDTANIKKCIKSLASSASNEDEGSDSGDASVGSSGGASVGSSGGASGGASGGSSQ